SACHSPLGFSANGSVLQESFPGRKQYACCSPFRSAPDRFPETIDTAAPLYRNLESVLAANVRSEPESAVDYKVSRLPDIFPAVRLQRKSGYRKKQSFLILQGLKERGYSTPSGRTA